MCAEAVPWRCHRSLIADALLARGIESRNHQRRSDAASLADAVGARHRNSGDISCPVSAQQQINMAIQAEQRSTLHIVHGLCTCDQNNHSPSEMSS